MSKHTSTSAFKELNNFVEKYCEGKGVSELPYTIHHELIQKGARFSPESKEDFTQTIKMYVKLKAIHDAYCEEHSDYFADV